MLNPAHDNDSWNREHVWPRSHGFPSEGQLAHSDIHHLRPADVTCNSDRGNLDFDESDVAHPECASRRDADSFEPRDAVKGDIARMLFYVDVRYAGADGVPDLTLIDADSATEQHEAEIANLNELLAAGAIDQETYARAVEDANDRALRSSQTWTDGATRFLKDYIAEGNDAATATEQAFANAFRGAEDSLVGFISTATAAPCSDISAPCSPGMGLTRSTTWSAGGTSGSSRYKATPTPSSIGPRSPPQSGAARAA